MKFLLFNLNQLLASKVKISANTGITAFKKKVLSQKKIFYEVTANK